MLLDLAKDACQIAFKDDELDTAGLEDGDFKTENASHLRTFVKFVISPVAGCSATLSLVIMDHVFATQQFS